MERKHNSHHSPSALPLTCPLSHVPRPSVEALLREGARQGGLSQDSALHRLVDLPKGCPCRQVKGVNRKGVNGELVAMPLVWGWLWSAVADAAEVVFTLLYCRTTYLRLRLLGHIFWQC